MNLSSAFSAVTSYQRCSSFAPYLKNPLAASEDILIGRLEQATLWLGSLVLCSIMVFIQVNMSEYSACSTSLPPSSLVNRLRAGLVGFQDQDTEDSEGKIPRVWAPIVYGGVLLKRTHLYNHFDLHLDLAEDSAGGKEQAMAYTSFSTGLSFCFQILVHS